MRQIISFLVLVNVLLGQQFSMMAATQESYLNFTDSESNSPVIYIDEGASLAWQNSISLSSFIKKEHAVRYCKSLKLGKFIWSLPTTSELKSLNLYSNIASGQKKRYMALNTPLWDNRLDYGYDAKKEANIAFKKNSKWLFVRCVAHLEE